ncbi:hypothetical protein B0H17DRAFT_1214982 [Mycena rosella]|uniref:Uncharacterized protein n=1 Tax=Mycena rosella TaxID=1033263 RepID=A0AAD7FZU5_MYCRO|nr:hypothetical protein B0H17DRAFT_1214982 [Mycena rosella]
MRESYAEKIAPVVAEKWAEERSRRAAAGESAGKEPKAGFRAQVVRDVFAKLRKEEQKGLGDRAKEDAVAAKGAYASALKTLQRRTQLRVRKALGEFMGPILQGLNAYTGLHSTLILGGPMPQFGGELRTTHVSYGRNNTNLAQHWPQWDKPRFAASVQEFMVEYLNTAFTAEDCANAALVGPDLSGAKYTIAPGGGAASNPGSDSDSDSDSDDDDLELWNSDDEEEEARPCKKAKHAKTPQAGPSGASSVQAPPAVLERMREQLEYEAERVRNKAALKEAGEGLRLAFVDLMGSMGAPGSLATAPVPSAPAVARSRPKPKAKPRLAAASVPRRSTRARGTQGAQGDSEMVDVEQDQGQEQDKATTTTTPLTSTNAGSPSGALTTTIPGAMTITSVPSATNLMPAATPPPPPAVTVAPTPVIPSATSATPITPSTTIPGATTITTVSSATTLTPVVTLLPPGTPPRAATPVAPTLVIASANSATPITPASTALPATPAAPTLVIHSTSAPTLSPPGTPPPAATTQVIPSATSATTPITPLSTAPASLDDTGPVRGSAPIEMSAERLTLMPCPPSAPPWFVDGRAVLSKQDLGCHFDALIAAWTRIEYASRFEHGPTNLSSKGRPAQLGIWIAGGWGRRGSLPVISDVALFAEKWGLWWTSLQPGWREKGRDGKWSSGGEYGEGGKDWGPLYQWGVNGTLTLLAGLYFWGCALKAGVHDSEVGMGEWEDAVADVTWMLEGMATYYEKFNRRF